MNAGQPRELVETLHVAQGDIEKESENQNGFEMALALSHSREGYDRWPMGLALGLFEAPPITTKPKPDKLSY